jgi:subtilisin family serine protease
MGIWENEMKKYNVLLQHPDDRIGLVVRFEKVGLPSAHHTAVIVQTEQPIEAIRETPGVLEVEEDMQVTVLQVNQADPLRALEWISQTPGYYRNERTGCGVDCYIVDTGIDIAHPEFEGRASTLWSYDGYHYGASNHGTAVASCVGGNKCGTAKEATLINVRVDMWVSSIIKGLDQVTRHHLTKEANRPSVVNISLAAASPILGDICGKMTERGIVIVAAAGNFSEPKPTWPANHPSVIEVGALNYAGTAPADFSNLGARFWSIGESVHVAIPNGGYGYMSGTSFASPHTAGLICCQLQGSDRFNNVEAGNYAHYLQSLCETVRLTWFPNSGATAHSVTTALPYFGLRPYYEAPSRRFTDTDIAEFCRQYETRPQVIADEAYSQNVDVLRLARCLPYSVEVINDYFVQAGVVPWWFVDGRPVV